MPVALRKLGPLCLAKRPRKLGFVGVSKAPVAGMEKAKVATANGQEKETKEGQATTRLPDSGSPQDLAVVTPAQGNHRKGHSGKGLGRMRQMRKMASEESREEGPTQGLRGGSYRASSPARNVVSDARARAKHRFLKLGRLSKKTYVRGLADTMSPLPQSENKKGSR